MVVTINGNWVKLFSKFMNWEWYKDSNTKDLFIHCLLKANWKDGRFEGVEIKRGSFVTSLKSLSEELGMTIQEIRTSLKHLISTNELTSKSTNKYRIITIVNYEMYQLVNKQPNTQLTNNQQSTNNQLTTIEEYKNNRIIDNSVCNNAYARENFNCHLGCNYKTENCKDCMKKYQCPLPDDPTFKGLHGKSFYEYMTELEERKVEVGKELERMSNSPKIDLSDIEDYDYFNDEGD